MSDLEYLFENNRKWVKKVKQEDPGFFNQLSKGQAPEILWIGCSDSRVPANQIMGLSPGDAFVHRNIANVVVHTDLNCLSVIQYAVEVLKVKHIIICGHYGCGGVQAAVDGHSHGLIDNWLLHIKDVYRANTATLEPMDEQEKLDRLCELNVAEQVKNVCSTTIVGDAWEKNQPLSVHGLIFNMEDGLLKDMNMSISSTADFDKLMTVI